MFHRAIVPISFSTYSLSLPLLSSYLLPYRLGTISLILDSLHQSVGVYLLLWHQTLNLFRTVWLSLLTDLSPLVAVSSLVPLLLSVD